MGSITLTKFIPANTFCELAESITRWKWAKRISKTFRLLRHRVIELSLRLSQTAECPFFQLRRFFSRNRKSKFSPESSPDAEHFEPFLNHSLFSFSAIRMIVMLSSA
jgi:hypothetical protein